MNTKGLMEVGYGGGKNLGVNKSAVTLIIQRNKIPAYIGRKERRENYVSLF